jgi:AcrR family transcriptional regulator
MTKSEQEPMARISTARPPAGRPRRQRGSLSREKILDAATAFISERGLDQLSMPVLARHLESGVTSIYWYFRSKEEMLVALSERTIEKIYADLPRLDRGAPWDEQALEYFRAFRDQLTQNPVYIEVFSYRGRAAFGHNSPTSPLIRRLEDEIAVFVGAGLSPVEAAHVYNACSGYVRGFCILERRLASEPDRAEASSTVRATIAALDPLEFPVLTALGDFEDVMRLSDKQFEVGLRLLLDGIRARLAR